MTAMMTLYRGWQAALAQCNASMPDDERDALVNSLLDPISDKLLAAPVVTAEDLLIRLRVELDAYLFGHDELKALLDREVEPMTGSDEDIAFLAGQQFEPMTVAPISRDDWNNPGYVGAYFAAAMLAKTKEELGSNLAALKFDQDIDVLDVLAGAIDVVDGASEVLHMARNRCLIAIAAGAVEEDTSPQVRAS